jgi:mono/diheme cytochrome c family protein
MYKTLTLCIAATLMLAPSVARAAEEEIGQREFRLRCAACHGPGGKGDGMIGQMLKVPPPDLTEISIRNGGAFPFKKVYEIIDGRTALAAHGSKEMPIWGDNYRAEQLPQPDLPAGATERQADLPERRVEEHITRLVYFIGTLQVQK